MNKFLFNLRKYKFLDVTNSIRIFTNIYLKKYCDLVVTKI